MRDRGELAVAVVDCHAIEAVCMENDEARGTRDRTVAGGVVFVAQSDPQAKLGKRCALPITAVPVLVKVIQRYIREKTRNTANLDAMEGQILVRGQDAVLAERPRVKAVPAPIVGAPTRMRG